MTGAIAVERVGVDVALRDGSTVRVRPVCPDDVRRLEAFLEGMSLDSRYLRFFSAGIDLGAVARRAAALAPPEGSGLVAVAGRPAEIVAHATWLAGRDGTAEIAFEVADAWHGRGIASVLLAHLAASAAAAGIETLTAVVLPENHRMLEVFRESGFPVTAHRRPHEIEIALSARVDPSGLERVEERERVAAVAAVERVLRPGSVAVLGATRPGSVAAAVVANLRAGGFGGPLAWVNPHGGRSDGVPVHTGLADVPFAVELAVLAVPAPAAVAAARDCAAAGVRALVVLSAGFAEAGPSGHARQHELLEVCRAAGMRMVGPNCIGVANPAPDVRLNATFAPHAPPFGRLAVASQSGGYGIAAIDEACRRGLGLSAFVSTGDKADMSGNDFLRAWEQDDATASVLLYLESFGNPRAFSRVARRVSAVKPVIAVKSGRTAAGARAAASHTGALVGASDRTVDALFAHAGVIRTRTLGEAFDAAQLLTGGPLPAGDRLAIVTNAGGPGIACADACAATGLRVEPLPTRTRGELAASLPDGAVLRNPIDLLAAATAADYERAIGLLVADDVVDAIVAIHIPTPLSPRADIVTALRRAAQAAARAGTPVAAVLMAADEELLRGAMGDGAGVPAYRTPEEAARAVAHVCGYARRRRQPRPAVPSLPGAGQEAAGALLARELAGGEGWLDPAAVAELLRSYGLPLVESRLAASPAAAAEAAAALGERCALKAVARGLVHKSDAGAVRLDVAPADAQAAAEAVLAAARAAGAEPQGVLVQPMAAPGVELLVGVTSDRDFGPVVACAAGGVATELIDDVQVRLAPLDREEAGAMIRALRTFPLLDGYRGAPRADVAALEDIVVRLAVLAAAHPQIAELDCNPVVVGAHGAVVVDARVRVAAPPPPRPWPSLDR
ncbi:MAG TPA: GNAT family N-acetyltransferase [Solirubrobacteraceae bacterium]|jgi:acyl-CoA synthetase (NDP forming)/GNAT superfamily N-acetyltransferase